MALTESKIKDLADKGFDKLFKKHREAWVELASKARDFAQNNITAGREPRADDIAKGLYPMLEVNQDLRRHQEDNHARGQRYVTWFVEYVIHQVLFVTEKTK